MKDRIASGEINLVHCPTDIVVAAFFRKPLQGHLFAKFRDIIMGITPSWAGGIMGRRREKKEGKRGEVGVVDYSMVEWLRPSIIW